MQRFPRVWVHIVSVLALFAFACGANMPTPEVSRPGIVDQKSLGNDEAEFATQAAAPVTAPEPQTAEAVDVADRPEAGEARLEATKVDAGGSSVEVAKPEPLQVSTKPSQRMLEIEAHLDVEVADVNSAAQRLRELLLARGATITQDSLTHDEGAQRAQFTFRIPSGSTANVLLEVERLGMVHDKNVAARDVSKDYFDTELRLQNLEMTLQRYTQLLQGADKIDDLIRIEHELTRLRGEIEQLKGALRYMRDRVAQATVHVTLWAPDSYSKQVVHPVAGLYPGLRLGWIGDAGHDQPSSGLMSLGASARFINRLSLDVDVLRPLEATGNDVDGFWLTFGADRYSEFLGNGRRRYLNPYIGVRVGYGHRNASDEFLAGITTGIEIIRTELLTLELDVRTLGLFSESAGNRLALQPVIGCNVAF